MTLSADILNQRSPYKLSQLGEFTFRFVTDQKIHYTVGFYKDTIFMDVHSVIIDVIFIENVYLCKEKCVYQKLSLLCKDTIEKRETKLV